MLEALDTNVVLYAYVDFRDPRKTAIARGLMSRLATADNGVVSTQVLKEFANMALKGASKLQQADVETYLLELANFRQAVVNDIVVFLAVRRHFANQISFYDALIVEAALMKGAEMLYTEDLQHGQMFDSLRIVNPFL